MFEFYRLSCVDSFGKVDTFVSGPIPAIGTELHIETSEEGFKRMIVTNVIFTLKRSDPETLTTVQPLVIAEFI